MEIAVPNGSQSVMQPLEVNLDGCGVDVLEAERDGQTYRQLRVTHLSGAVVFTITFNEAHALNIGRRLAGSKLVIADAIDNDTAA